MTRRLATSHIVKRDAVCSWLSNVSQGERFGWTAWASAFDRTPPFSWDPYLMQGSAVHSIRTGPMIENESRQ